MANALYESHPSIPNAVRLRSVTVDVPKDAFSAEAMTPQDFNHADYQTPGFYYFANIAAVANSPANAPSAGGVLLVARLSNGSIEYLLREEFTDRTWKQGQALPATGTITSAGWTETLDRSYANDFTGTTVLGADANAVAALDAQISAFGDYIADLSALTDGPGGLTGPGKIQSQEMSANTGRYERTITEYDTGNVYTNYWDGAAWLPEWQGGTPSSTSLTVLSSADNGQTIAPGFYDLNADAAFSVTLEAPAESYRFANSRLNLSATNAVTINAANPATETFTDISGAQVAGPIVLDVPGYGFELYPESATDWHIVDAIIIPPTSSQSSTAAAITNENWILSLGEALAGQNVPGQSDGPAVVSFSQTIFPPLGGTTAFELTFGANSVVPGTLDVGTILIGTTPGASDVFDSSALGVNLSSTLLERTEPITLNPGFQYFVTMGSGPDGSIIDPYFSVREVGVAGINASGFSAPGDENSLGINSDDNLQTLAQKVENYVDWAPSVASEVTETLASGLVGSTAVPFTATFTADETGYYIAEHRALSVNPNAYIQIGTTLGGTDLLDTVPSTPDRLFPTELTKFYRIFMKKGQTAFVQTAPGGGGTAQGVGFSIRPISRGNEYTPENAIPLLGNYSVDLIVGDEHNEGPIDIGEPSVTIETGHNLIDADTLHIVVTDINQPEKPWDIIEIPIPEFLAKGESFGHVYGTGYIEVFVGNAATGQIILEDENRNLTYQRSWVTKRTLVGTSGISPRVGEIVPVAAVGFKTPAQGYLPWKDGRVVNGAIDYPVFASMVPWWVDGNDLLFEGTVDGAYIRNLGGNAAAEGVFQSDATAVNGLSATYRRVNNQVSTNVNNGAGNTLRSFGEVALPLTGDIETRPAGYAFQYYVIVDTYREAAGAGAASITPAHGRMELTNNQAIAAAIQDITMNTGGGSDRGVYPFDTVTVAKGGMVVTPGGFVDNDATTQVMDGTNTTSSMVVPRAGDYEFKISVPSALDSTIENDDRPLAAISVNGAIVKVYNIHDLANSTSSADQDKAISDTITLPGNALVQAGYYIEGGDDEAWGYRPPLETAAPDSATIVYAYFELRQLPESVTPSVASGTGGAAAEVGTLTLASAVTILAGISNENPVSVPLAGARKGDIFSTPSLSVFESTLRSSVLGVDVDDFVVVDFWETEGVSAVTLPIGTEIKVAKIA